MFGATGGASKTIIDAAYKIDAWPRMAALGHQPTFYLRSLECRLCEEKQPFTHFPGELLESARSGHSSNQKNQYIVRSSVDLLSEIRMHLPKDIEPSLVNRRDSDHACFP